MAVTKPVQAEVRDFILRNCRKLYAVGKIGPCCRHSCFFVHITILQSINRKGARARMRPRTAPFSVFPADWPIARVAFTCTLFRFHRIGYRCGRPIRLIITRPTRPRCPLIPVLLRPFPHALGRLRSIDGDNVLRFDRIVFRQRVFSFLFASLNYTFQLV